MTFTGILAATTPAAAPVGGWMGTIAGATFLGNTPAQWVGLFGVLLGGLVIGKFISFTLQTQSRRLKVRAEDSLLAVIFQSISGPVTLICLAGALYIAGQFMSLAGVTSNGTPWNIQNFWMDVCATIVVLSGAWFLYKMVDVVEHYLVRWTSKTETLLDDQLVPLVRKTLRVFVVIVSVLFIGQNIFEWDIGALLAGLGVGGLAFALAAKDMLANLFGSVAIFADRPFQMNDRVVISGRDGVVEEVGFRSTRVRLLNGHLVTVPNSVVANETIENISARPYIRRVLDVTVTYDTAPEKVLRGIEIIREMFEARKGKGQKNFCPDNPPRVFFSDFNAESLNIVVYYWFTPPDWWEYLAFNHDFNMELLRRFNDAGIEFAFPTRTLYLKQDSALAADVRLSGAASQARDGEGCT